MATASGDKTVCLYDMQPVNSLLQNPLLENVLNIVFVKSNS